MAPLFSKVDLNKLWHDVQHEETLICAKSGKDLFNISKVIGRKKVAQFFLTHSVEYTASTIIHMACVVTESKRVRTVKNYDEDAQDDASQDDGEYIMLTLGLGTWRMCPELLSFLTRWLGDLLCFVFIVRLLCFSVIDVL